MEPICRPIHRKGGGIPSHAASARRTFEILFQRPFFFVCKRKDTRLVLTIGHQPCEETQFAEHERYSVAIQQQMDLVNRIDLDELRTCTQGWAHWDLHVDNLMFQDDRIADILDFDRISYVYRDFDISRALLSCALTPNDGFPVEKIRAYIEGYSCFTSLSAARIARSIQLTWYKECEWIHAKYSTNRQMSRFIEELIWIGDHWDELERFFEEVQGER